MLSPQQQKYNQAVSDGKGSECQIHNFLQPYKIPSETTITQRQNPFNQPPPQARLWVFMHSCKPSDRHDCDRRQGKEITLPATDSPHITKASVHRRQESGVG